MKPMAETARNANEGHFRESFPSKSIDKKRGRIPLDKSKGPPVQPQQFQGINISVAVRVRPVTNPSSSTINLVCDEKSISVCEDDQSLAIKKS